jgi:hypothetical protein
MMASAHLEFSVLMAIARHGGNDLAKKACKSGHAARLNVLQKLASDRDEETQDAVKAIIAQLREFNKQRNHVAHNSLSYAFDLNSTESHKFGAIIDLADPTRRIGLVEVAALAEKGERLSRGFNFVWMMTMGLPD